MKVKIMKTVDIVERIEGEAKLNLTWKDKKVSDASIDFLNFRCFSLYPKNLWNMWTSSPFSNCQCNRKFI